MCVQLKFKKNLKHFEQRPTMPGRNCPGWAGVGVRGSLVKVTGVDIRNFKMHL